MNLPPLSEVASQLVEKFGGIDEFAESWLKQVEGSNRKDVDE